MQMFHENHWLFTNVDISEDQSVETKDEIPEIIDDDIPDLVNL